MPVEYEEKANIAALARFVREPQEDPVATRANGIYTPKDVDMAYITPPYSNGGSEHGMEASIFLQTNEEKVRNGRLSRRFADHYIAQYEAWKKGQELPLDGTPIRGWMVISPAQQEMLLARRFYTVEYLAEANDEGLRAIGMEGLTLKRKAVAWLSQAKDKAPLTIEIAAVKAENDALKVSIDTLKEQVDALMQGRTESTPKRGKKTTEE